MMRLFVGLALPEAVRERLGWLQAGVPGARWVRPDSMHVTLRFVGDIDDDIAADLDAALGRIDAPGFALRLDGVGQFGTPRRAEVLWSGVERTEPLRLLRDKVERATIAAGLPADSRKFAPHVTLGRLKSAPPDRVRRWLADHAPFQAGPIVVERFVLFRSHLGKEGSIYEELAEYLLAGPDAPPPGLPPE